MIKAKFRLDKDRVPILRKSEIDEWGEAFVHDYCPAALHEPTPIDVDLFACGYLGLIQDFAWLSNDGRYLGMTVFNDTGRVIIYDPESDAADYMKAKAGTVIIDNGLLDRNKEHRYRFTMGHECAHAIFHKEHFAYDPDQTSFLYEAPEPMIQCREDGATNLSKKSPTFWTPTERMEWQANRLASAILMPRSTVYKLIRSLPKGRGPDYDAMAIFAVSESFDVSLEAAQYRLLDFDLVQSRVNPQVLLDFAE